MVSFLTNYEEDLINEILQDVQGMQACRDYKQSAKRVFFTSAKSNLKNWEQINEADLTGQVL